MGYYNGGYKFTDLSSKLASDERYLVFLMHSSKDVSVIHTSPSRGSLYRRALADSKVNPATVSTLVGSGPDENVGERVSAVEDFLQDADRERLGVLTQTLGYQLEMLARTPSVRDRIYPLMVKVLEGCTNEQEATRLVQHITNAYGGARCTSEDQRTEVLGLVRAVFDRYKNDESSALHSLLAEVRSTPSGCVDGTHMWQVSNSWVSDSLKNIVAFTTNADVFDAVANDPELSTLIPWSEVYACQKVDGGERALAYALANPERAELLYAMSRNVTVGNRTDFIRFVTVGILDGSENDPLRRHALRLLIEADPYEADRYLPDFERFISEPTADGAVRRGQAQYGGMITPEAILRDASENAPLTYLKSIYDRSGSISATYGYLSHAGVRNSIIKRIADLVPGAVERGTLSVELAADLWGICATDRAVTAGVGKPSAALPSAEQALMLSGKLSHVIVEAAAATRSGVSKFARAILKGEDPALLVKKQPSAVNGSPTQDAWDKTVGKSTTFATYLQLATDAGYTPAGALGMYLTDVRIDLTWRAEARYDFIALLNSAPSFADEVPEPVWAALVRVRDPLPMSTELCLHLQTLGEAAQRIGSRNVVKFAMS